VEERAHRLALLRIHVFPLAHAVAHPRTLFRGELLPALRVLEQPCPHLRVRIPAIAQRRDHQVALRGRELVPGR
jgi:hypothetical protein